MNARRSPLGWVAVSGVGTAFALAVYLHMVAGQRVSPLLNTVSAYVYTPHGAAFAVMCLALAFGSLGVTTAVATCRPLVHDARRRQVVAALLGAWCLGLSVAAVFPTDPIGGAMSPAGEAHRWAIVLAFASLPCAGWLLSRGSARPHVWTGHARTVRALSAASFAAIAILMLSYVPVLFPPFADLPILVGATERVLLAVDVLLMLALTRPLLAVRSAARPAVPRSTHMSQAPPIVVPLAADRPLTSRYTGDAR